MFKGERYFCLRIRNEMGSEKQFPSAVAAAEGMLMSLQLLKPWESDSTRSMGWAKLVPWKY